ncbi:hypothetical protein PRUPE_5G075900 [Prunus persica]|uniref:Pentapeptide repeat protein n=1 Tax=Prunus persica TaxID=3760 RepID=A0A251P547_PRUPE|nr:hypothetical protein PRUPE_5G075900 [Prunus persica]
MAAAVISFSSGMPAIADLNKFEADTPGEFGIGSAAQFGSADLRKAVHVNENFRRANFTSADMRESDFSGSTFNGAYLEKAVAYKANFAGADLSDTLMDRMMQCLLDQFSPEAILGVPSLKVLTSVTPSWTSPRSRLFASMQVGRTQQQG